MQPSQRGNEQRLELAESLSTFGYDVRFRPSFCLPGGLCTCVYIYIAALPDGTVSGALHSCTAGTRCKWLCNLHWSRACASLQATFLTLQVSRLNNSLVINSRLPGYVNLTNSPFLATFQVQSSKLPASSL